VWLGVVGFVGGVFWGRGEPPPPPPPPPPVKKFRL
jgi:hypothetical protein